MEEMYGTMLMAPNLQTGKWGDPSTDLKGTNQADHIEMSTKICLDSKLL